MSFGEGNRIVRMVDLYRGPIINVNCLDRVKYPRPISSGYKLNKGDILINRTSLKKEGIGQVSLISELEENCYFDCSIIRARPNKLKAFPKYLLWALNTYFLKAQIMKIAKTATITTISQPGIYELKVPIPKTIEEQIRIANILDKADALWQKRQQTIELADQFLRSVFLDMFGDPFLNPKQWKKKNLGDLLSGIVGGWSPTCLKQPSKTNEWGVLTLGSISSCIYDSNKNKTLPKELSPKPELEVKKGDILFSRKNTYELIGASVLVEETEKNIMFSDLIFRLEISKDIDMNSRFLWNCLTHPAIRNEIRTLASGSAGSMPNVSKERLKLIRIPIPDTDLQITFDKIHSKITQLKKHINELNIQSLTLFNSLNQRAFRGEL